MRPSARATPERREVPPIRLIGRRGARASDRDPSRDPVLVADASRRIRQHLDPEAVVRAVVQEIASALSPISTSVWLARGGPPQRVFVAGRNGPTPEPITRAVETTVTRRRPIRIDLDGHRVLAVPLVAPTGSLIGAICVEAEAIGSDDQRIIEGLSIETGFALETATLYAHAVAGKEKSDAILGRVADAIIVTDGAGKITDWNRAAETIIGISSSDALTKQCSEVLGLHLGERPLRCEDAAELAASASNRLALGIEVWRDRGDGRRQPLLLNVSIVAGTDGAISATVFSLRDVTRLKEADEAKTMFLATASHELKTPLTVIKGFAQLLASSRIKTDEDRKEALNTIADRSEELNAIVERVLLSSRIEAGRAEVSVAEHDLAAIVRDRAEAMRGARRREVVVSVDELVPHALVDRSAVETIIDHLIDNAIKYSPEGGPVWVQVGSDDRHVIVSITDPGIGMDPDQVERCFEKFWQAESSDIRRFGGTGIGLYIVRSLAEGMGGSVRAESVPGVGSTFTVTVSRADAKDETEAEPVPAVLTPGIGEPSMVREFMRQLGIPTRGLLP